MRPVKEGYFATKECRKHLKHIYICTYYMLNMYLLEKSIRVRPSCWRGGWPRSGPPPPGSPAARSSGLDLHSQGRQDNRSFTPAYYRTNCSKKEEIESVTVSLPVKTLGVLEMKLLTFLMGTPVLGSCIRTTRSWKQMFRYVRRKCNFSAFLVKYELKFP